MGSDRRLDFGNSHWRDLHNTSREDLERLAAEYDLPRHMILDCLEPGHLPKFQRGPKVSFLMLRSFDESSPLSATTAQEITRKIAIFWGENFLLSVHRSSYHWLDLIFETWQKKRETGQLAPLLRDIVEECLYTYEDPIDKATVAVEELEDTVFHQATTRPSSRSVLESTYLAKKRATVFKRLLRLTRDILPLISKLEETGSAAIQNLKEEADRLYFYADDLVEGANDLIQLSISLSANRLNEVVRLLTLVSIFLLPLNLIAGIYGMNFHFMPELDKKWGYPAVLVFMVVVEVVIFLVLKNRGWIRKNQRAP